MAPAPSFNELIKVSIQSNWDKDALTNYKGSTLQYHDVTRKIEKLIMFECSGLHSDDKVAFMRPQYLYAYITE